MTNELAAMTSVQPTRRIDWAKPGDTVRVLGGNMTGTVIRVVQTGSVPYAVVQWPLSVGRHTITTLQTEGASK